MRKLPKLHGLAIVSAAYRDGDMLSSVLWRLHSICPGHLTTKRSPALVATRRSVASMDKYTWRPLSINSLAICAPDDPVPTTKTALSGSVLRVAVFRRVKLVNTHRFGNRQRLDRSLKRTSRRNVVRFNDAMRGSGLKPGAVWIRHNFFDLPVLGRFDLVCVRDQIVDNLGLRCKPVGACIRKRHTRETVMPSRFVGDQRIPAFTAPTFCNSMSFEYHVRDGGRTEVFTIAIPA